MVPMGDTLILDWRSMLNMNLWYPDVINYELVVSYDVAMISAMISERNKCNVRLEDGL